MALYLVTPPTAEPIDRDEAKAHLRVTASAEDPLIDVLIGAARRSAESYLRRSLVLQTWERVMDDFPSGSNEIELPRPPLQAVSSLKYVDTDGNTTTWDASNYVVDTQSFVGRLVLAYSKIWPTATLRTANAVTVRYAAGYAVPFTVDADTDTLTAVGHQYSDKDIVRLSVSGGSSAALPAGLSAKTDYYVINTSGDDLQLSTTSGGSAVDITDTGDGTFFLGEIPEEFKAAMLLMIGHLYVNREAINIGNIVNELPLGWEDLLAPERVY